MADGLRFAPLLLVAIAVGPASAEPSQPSLQLQSVKAVAFSEPPSTSRDRAMRHRLFQNDDEVVPGWSLPFGLQSDERDSRRVTFSVRPGRGLKARARIRF